MLSDEILPNVYCLRSSIYASPNLISQNCHARSIRVKRVCPHRNVIDRLCDANEKFEYFNTDDSWLAFTFFLSLFSKVFTTAPSKSLFSTQFVDMVERHCRTDKSISYQKKFNVCSDGFVRSTISYSVTKLDRLLQEGDEGKMRAV